MSTLTQRNPISSPSNGEQEPPESTPPQPQLKRQRSSTQHAMSQTLSSAANLANLLPTGTLLAFQLLMPIFTSNGSCDYATRVLTAVLLTLLSISCFLGSFTDSVMAEDGKVYYGFATRKGMWVFDYPDPSGAGLPDLSKYRMRIIDWIHGVFVGMGLMCCWASVINLVDLLRKIKVIRFSSIHGLQLGTFLVAIVELEPITESVDSCYGGWSWCSV